MTIFGNNVVLATETKEKKFLVLLLKNMDTNKKERIHESIRHLEEFFIQGGRWNEVLKKPMESLSHDEFYWIFGFHEQEKYQEVSFLLECTKRNVQLPDLKKWFHELERRVLNDLFVFEKSTHSFWVFVEMSVGKCGIEVPSNEFIAKVRNKTDLSGVPIEFDLCHLS
jgi:hypothetical protein